MPIVVHVEHVCRTHILADTDALAKLLIQSDPQQPIWLQAAFKDGCASRHVDPQYQQHDERREAPTEDRGPRKLAGQERVPGEPDQEKDPEDDRQTALTKGEEDEADVLLGPTQPPLVQREPQKDERRRRPDQGDDRQHALPPEGEQQKC